MTVSAGSLFPVFLCRPEISEELRTLILRMLDKNPDTRITLSEIKVASEQTQARPGQARPCLVNGESERSHPPVLLCDWLRGLLLE